MVLKPRSIAIGCIVIALSAFILFLYFNLFFVHDRMLWQFRAKYRTVRHPANTQRVRFYSDLGLLIGNGNHCDLFVGELRSYTGARRELLKAYAGQSYWSPIEHDRLPVEVLFVEDNGLREGILYHGEIGFELPSPLGGIREDAMSYRQRSKKYYVVYMFDPGYDAGFDIRCQ